jgi:haloacetate dehalogenase
MCEDYRAAASIDLDHDRDDIQSNRRIEVPLRILWGSRSLVGEIFEPVELWSRVAVNVTGRALDCGHYLPEEAPEEVLEEIRATFRA